MNTFIYDGTFEGLITTIQYSLKNKILPDSVIRSMTYQGDLFCQEHKINSNEKLALQAWNAYTTKVSEQALKMPYRAFLSERPGIDHKIFLFIRNIITGDQPYEDNYRDETTLELKNMERRVLKDAMRLIQFVRFRKTKDEIYFAPVEPDFDVIRLSADHFRDRFADQKWLIYDTRREYGIFYDLKEVNEIKLITHAVNEATGKIRSDVLEDHEELYETLWKNYYRATTTEQRRNMKLHMQYLPKKFWKYLPEKE